MASERTALAWLRTGALLAAVSGIGVAAAAHRGRLAIGAVCAVVPAALALLVVRHGRAAYRDRRREERYTADAAGARLILVASLGTACAALAMILAGT